MDKLYPRFQLIILINNLTNLLFRNIRDLLAKEIKERSRMTSTIISPHLVIIQVGNREDSNLYVRQKQKAAQEVGIKYTLCKKDENITENELLKIISEYNNNSSIHGILVQLPLPNHIDQKTITESVDPNKDVDGFHTYNIGSLAKRSNQPLFLPCTTKAIIELLNQAGKQAIVIGRSDVVGIPTFLSLSHLDATVTLCHSKTENLNEIVCIKLITHILNIIVVAIGKPKFIKGDWIKPGAIIIDVGTNPIKDPSKKYGVRWVGDVDFVGASKVASYITPVPGGVGPMTVAMLLRNTFESAKKDFLKNKIK
ncbi:7284_t:CDS:2 [Entrophospora sp. SA101]|nr:7284_t:CDS:2 [Entrophospora sp. SA101]